MLVIESELKSVRGMSNRSHRAPSDTDWRPVMRTALVTVMGMELEDVHATRTKLLSSPLEKVMPNISFRSVNWTVRTMLPTSPGGMNATPVLGVTKGRSFVTPSALEPPRKCAAIVALTKIGAVLTTRMSSPSTVDVVGFKATAGGRQRGTTFAGLRTNGAEQRQAPSSQTLGGPPQSATVTHSPAAGVMQKPPEQTTRSVAGRHGGDRVRERKQVVPWPTPQVPSLL
jgi:hypothetical protein